MESFDDENNVVVMYDGPQPYNYEPARRERGDRTNIRPTSLIWSEENAWRAGQVSWWVALAKPNTVC